jgi:hypothetical protein
VKLLNKQIKKTISALLFSFLIVAVIFSSIGNGAVVNANQKHVSKSIIDVKNPEINRDTQYWALLVAVGTYYQSPDKDRPSMLEAVDDLYDTLVDSPNWQAANIHVLKGSQATLFNLIRELLWLIKNSDKDDYCLLYITTHGYPLTINGQPLDLPPKDELDGDDEVLIMHYGFTRFYDQITDDMLRFFLRFLRAKGLCVIIDSCFSGGFDDSIKGYDPNVNKFDSEKFKQGMVEELAAEGRIILMSCEEEESSYGSYFSNYLISGLSGWGDYFGNNDGINSAEEAFSYAYPWVVIFTGGKQHPTISDQFPGEFALTYN